MKIPAVARLRPGSAHCRGHQWAPEALPRSTRRGTCPPLGPPGRLGTLAWGRGTVKHARGRRRDTGMRPRAVGTPATQAGRQGPLLLTREGLGSVRPKSPPRLWFSISGAGSLAGRRAERRAGGHALCSRCLPSQPAWGDAWDSDGEGALSVTRVGCQRRDTGETRWGLGPGGTGNEERGGRPGR